ATAACGGRARHDVAGCAGGSFFEPTVLVGVQPEHSIAREEGFGPVLAVLEIADLDDAIDVVNSVEYGLSSCIYSRTSTPPSTPSTGSTPASSTSTPPR